MPKCSESSSENWSWWETSRNDAEWLALASDVKLPLFIYRIRFWSLKLTVVSCKVPLQSQKVLLRVSAHHMEDVVSFTQVRTHLNLSLVIVEGELQKNISETPNVPCFKINFIRALAQNAEIVINISVFRTAAIAVPRSIAVSELSIHNFTSQLSTTPRAMLTAVTLFIILNRFQLINIQ